MKKRMVWPLVIALMPLSGNAAAQEPNSGSVDTTSARGTKKRIVICLDGTSNNAYKEKERYSAKEGNNSKVLKPSNVLKTCRAVLPEADGVTQITYYDIGVGALAKHPGVYNRMLRTADSVLGGAWGAGFESRVEDAYRFLSHNYLPGDDVFVFGFSRGAAAARALGRFIDWMGGVPSKRDVYWIPIFFRSYETSTGRAEGAEVLRIKHRVDMRPVEINFLGVWDTVLALGSRLKTRTKTKAFHIGETPPRSVRVARQALAIDEQRFDFRPEIWQTSLDGQSLEQRWFAGVHSNIGGGYPTDGLANLAMAWILREAESAGLQLDWPYLSNFRPYPQAKRYESRKFFYRLKEAATFRVGDGVRKLAPSGGVEAADSAGLSLDCSVLGRLGSNPAENVQMSEAYGKGRKALLRYLSDCRAHDAWLTDSVRSLLGKGGTNEVCLPVSPTVYLSQAGPTLPNPSCLRSTTE